MMYRIALWIALDRFFPMSLREIAVVYIARKDVEAGVPWRFSALLRERNPRLRKYPRPRILYLARKDGKAP